MWRQLRDFIGRFVRSLSFKLSFHAGLITFIAVVAFAYHTISVQEQGLIQEKIQGAMNDSEVIKAAIWNGMMTKERDGIRQIVRTIGSSENFKEINIYDQNGVLHYTSNPENLAQVGKKKGTNVNPLLSDMQENTNLRYRFFDDGKSLNVVNPLRNTESCSSAACHAHPPDVKVLGALDVNLPLAKVRRQIRDNAYSTVAFAFALFLLISTISGLAIVFGVLPPIRRLQDGARKMAQGRPSGSPVPEWGSDEIGELTRIFNDMSLQIGERTRLLEESRQLFKDLFDKVPCYLAVINRDYQVVQANATFEQEFGNLIGKTCWTGFKGLDARCPNCQVERTFADSLPHRSEEVWSMPGKGGDTSHVIVHTSPILDQDGTVKEVLEMAVDISRVEKLQAALRKKEEEFKNLFETVPCYLTVIDSSFRIAYYNKLFAKEFGDYWGRTCHSVYKGKDEKCVNCPVEKTLLDGLPHTSEDIWIREGREIHVVINTSAVTDDNGVVVAVMEMCTNITELKELRSELAVLGETIAGMSHAVKNILSGLEGGVYVVDSGLKSGRQERIGSGWNMVKRNVALVSELVRDILYASKERKPECRLCDVAAILSEVYELYRGKAQAQGIELIVNANGRMDPVWVDPNGIHSAVSNLVSNAIGACVDFGIERQFRIELSGRIGQGILFIEVSDNGMGMSEEIRDNLFKKFYSTKGSKGTGLGLVVTKKIVEEHGGTIRVASWIGQGTTFTIEIPLRQEASAALESTVM